MEHEDGKRTLLSAKDPNQRQAIAKRLLTPSTDSKGALMSCKKVGHQLLLLLLLFGCKLLGA